MKIAIIGAGTAGWSCAAALSKNKNLQITLISSKELKSIGVGESTLPMVRGFHEKFSLFFDNSWLKKVNGTLKYTLEFEGFLENQNKKWFHPLSTYKKYEEYMSLKNMDKNNEYLANNFFYTQKLKNSSFHGLENYNLGIGAFHFDAKLYANELKQIALNRGVIHIEKTIKELIQEKNITNRLILDDDSFINAELFIDCSGFENILFKAFNNSFESFSNRLYCDSAVAIKVDYKDEKIQKINATLAKALKNGWVWHIPLEDKIAFGYVYSSKHTTQEKAKKEFFEYLQERYSYNTKEFEATFIKYRSGVHKKSWIGNNIAIGLSSFFIEPLESTGIALFQIQIMELAKILETNPDFYMNYKNRYNQIIYDYVLSVRDFIEMHYITSNRKDSQFWIDATSIVPNEFQQKILDLYEHKKYKEILEFDFLGIFGSLSWLHLLMGMDLKKN